MEYLTVEEAAAILKVRENTVRDWLKSGKLKGHKIGRIWRLTEEAISEFVEKGETQNGKA
ncbi:MAG: helix-turn-helix domain-containing protein [Dethiobacteria bacterium]|nr:helix-turn-helix domain-containing protein [Dethiobacteria bacterium]